MCWNRPSRVVIGRTEQHSRWRVLCCAIVFWIVGMECKADPFLSIFANAWLGLLCWKMRERASKFVNERPRESVREEHILWSLTLKFSWAAAMTSKSRLGTLTMACIVFICQESNIWSELINTFSLAFQSRRYGFESHCNIVSEND